MKAILITVSIIGLAAVFGAIYVGSRSFEGLVTDKPYDKAIMWDQTRHEREKIGWSAKIKKTAFTTGRNAIILNVLSKDGSDLKGAVVGLTISRPNTTRYDNTCSTEEKGDGEYWCYMNFPLYGYWDIRVSIEKDKKHVSFDKRIFVQKGG